MSQASSRIAEAAESAAATFARVQQAAQIQTDELARRRKKALQERRRQSLKYVRPKNKRLACATQGLEALRSLIRTPQVDTLLRVQNTLTLASANLYIPSSGDGEGGRNPSLELDLRIMITRSRLEILERILYSNKEDEGERIHRNFPHDSDGFLSFLALRRIATGHGCDVKHELRTLSSMKADRSPAPSLEILFQILVDCAEPQKLEQYLLRAMNA